MSKISSSDEQRLWVLPDLLVIFFLSNPMATFFL